MRLFRDIKHRIFAAGIMGMLVCILIYGNGEMKMPLAWWGILYPEYCFMEVRECEEEIEQKSDEIKISFWLAKVFDW